MLSKTLRWLLTGRHPLWAAVVIVVLIIVSVVIKPIASYATAQPQNATLVAALIALLGILITQIVNTILARTGQRNLQKLEAQRANEAALQKYLEQVGKLLVEKSLRDAVPGDNLSTVARAQTLAVLKGLRDDRDRKRVLMLFLSEAQLLNTDKKYLVLDWLT